MKRLLAFVVAVLAWGAMAEDRPATTQTQDGNTFTVVDVYIDPQGKPLAAWQFEFVAETGKVTLVGVENGKHAAYLKRPPYYDQAAINSNRIIVADFSLDRELPREKVLVAKLMLMVSGNVKPQYVVKLMAAAAPDGKPIAATVTLGDAR
jgi:hypothetical protein